MQRTSGRLRTALDSSLESGRRWASIGSDQVTSVRDARADPWRLVFAAGTIVIPLLAIALLAPNVDAALVAPMLVVSVMLASYVADWAGGITAIVVGVVLLDVTLLGERWSFDAWRSARDIVILLLFVVLAGTVAATVERLKYDQANARIDAAAMRAANTALNAVEIAAAQRPAGDNAAYVSVFENILTAMVRVNRASAGAIYLTNNASTSLVQAVTYGRAADPDHREVATVELPFGDGFMGRVARERRPVSIADTTQVMPEDVGDVIEVNPHIRSVLGVPLIGRKIGSSVWPGSDSTFPIASPRPPPRASKRWRIAPWRSWNPPASPTRRRSCWVEFRLAPAFRP